MKTFTTIFLSLISIALITVSFTNPPDSLVGRWQQTVGKLTGLLVFRTDNTFDVFINGKTFVSGNYSVRQDTLLMADPRCNMAYQGTYRFGFFAGDSIRFTVLEDTCRGRRETFRRVPTLGRVTALVNPTGQDKGKIDKP